MKIETQGWGSSMIATKYVHERLTDLRDEVQKAYLNNYDTYDVIKDFDDYLKELEHNYKVDTGEKINES